MNDELQCTACVAGVCEKHLSKQFCFIHGDFQSFVCLKCEQKGLDEMKERLTSSKQKQMVKSCLCLDHKTTDGTCDHEVAVKLEDIASQIHGGMSFENIHSMLLLAFHLGKKERTNEVLKTIPDWLTPKDDKSLMWLKQRIKEL